MDVQQDVDNIGRGELFLDKSKIFGKKDAVKSILYRIDPEVPIQNIRRLAREVCDQNNSIFKNVDSLIIYRLNIFNRLNLYPFIFENEKISHSLKNLSNI